MPDGLVATTTTKQSNSNWQFYAVLSHNFASLYQLPLACANCAYLCTTLFTRPQTMTTTAINQHNSNTIFLIISSFTESKMVARPLSWKIQMAISPQRVIQYTSSLVQGWVFGVGWSNGAISSWTKFNKNVAEANAQAVITLVTI